MPASGCGGGAKDGHVLLYLYFSPASGADAMTNVDNGSVLDVNRHGESNGTHGMAVRRMVREI